MAISANNWKVHTDQKNLAVLSWVQGRVVPGNVHWIFDWLCEQFDKRVEKIDRSQSWGWAYRPIRGKTSGYSNHASGTAIDLNAVKHPIGVRNTFTPDKQRVIRSIVAETDGAIRWGGDYKRRPDDMHYEINTDQATLSAVVQKLKSKYANTESSGSSQSTDSSTNSSYPYSNTLTLQRLQRAATENNLTGRDFDHRRQALTSLHALGVVDRTSPKAGESWTDLVKGAWSTWQKALGYTGSDADGVPGALSVYALARRVGLKYWNEDGGKSSESNAPYPNLDRIKKVPEPVGPLKVTINSASHKQVRVPSNMWGSVSGYSGPVTVTSQVHRNGTWVNSRTVKISPGDMYILPLSYGMDVAGTYRWRVVAHQNNQNYAISPTITFYRTQVTANSAGSAKVGAKANVWGTAYGFIGDVKVSTQVLINGSWSTSQRRTVKAGHQYVIPLTYGSGSAGTRTWRVIASDGHRYAESYTFQFTREARATSASTGSSGGRLRNPTAGGRITTPFGKAPNRPTYWRAFGRHTGADFSHRTVSSRALYAVDSGIVTYRWDSVLGHIAILQADSLKGRAHRYFWYAHLSGKPSKTGRVKRGDRIGTMGQTGTGANGVHLHLELLNSGTRWGRVWNDFRNPARYVSQG